MSIRLTKAEKIRILNALDIYGIMQKILLRENKINRNREHLWVVGLEANNLIQYIELVSMGSRTKTIGEPMEVFSLALQKKSVGIILVHNHPSGNLVPSKNDKDLTDRLIQVGLIVATPVLDHLIISIDDFYSFKDSGILDQLELSQKYIPQFLKEKEYKKQAKAEIEKGRNKVIAKDLKGRGFSVEEIAEITGLTLTEVRRLKATKKK